MRTLCVLMSCSWVTTRQRLPGMSSSVKGCKRFLERVAGLTDFLTEEPASQEMETKIHQTIKKVSADIEAMKFNTAIAALMTLINDLYTVKKITRDDLIIIIKLLVPVCSAYVRGDLGADRR